MTARRLFVFGLGYTAQHLVRACLAEDWGVAGTYRGETPTALGDLGVETYRFDRDRPLSDPGAVLAGTTHLLSSVPPDDEGDSVLDCHGRDIGALKGLEWVGYLSTTGVYGNRGGGEVDESSPLSPTSERGRRRVAAEAGWLALHKVHDLPAHIFRLAGIYGPGRSAIDAVRAGTAKRIAMPGHVFSRIHVDDIVGTLRASAARPNPGAIYNLCDDRPAAGEAVIAYACKLLKIEPPPLVPIGEAGLSPMAASFYRDNKRVSNARIKRELGVRLRYPNYRAGLEAILEGEA